MVNSAHQNLDTQWATLEGSGAQGPTLDIWGFFKRRKSFVIVFAVVGAGLGYLLFNQKVPQFRSIARVEVIHRVTENILQGLLGKDMLEDAMYVIPSPNVLEPAYDSHNLSRLETLRGMTKNEAVAVISRGLTISQLSQGVIELQYTGTHPQDSTRITNAVAEEYIKRQTSSFETETEKLKRLLEIDREKIDKQLQIAEEDYEEFNQRARLLAATGDSSLARGRLSTLSSQISQLDIEEAELMSRLSLFNEKLGKDGQRDVLLVMIGKEFEIEEGANNSSSADPVIDHQQRRNHARMENNRRMSEVLLPLVIESAILEQKVGSGHPRLREVRQRIELVRQEYTKMERLIPDLDPEPDPEPLGDQTEVTPDYLAVYHQSLSHELEKLRAQRSDLKKLAATAEQEAFLVCR